jgi:O-antigen ligase
MILINPKRFVVREINKIMEAVFSFWERKHAFLMRVTLVAGVLVLAPVLGLLVVKMQVPLLAVVAAGVPLVIVGLQFILPRFDLAPIVILFAAAFVPISLPTGTESRLVDSLLLTLLFVGNWVLKMLLVDKRLHLEPSPINKPLLGFMGITLIALVWSMAMRDPLVVVGQSVSIVQTASAIVMIMLPGAFLLVGNHIRNLKLLNIMVIMMLVAGAITVPYRLNLMPILLANDNGLFTMWVVSLALSLALFHGKLSWQWRGSLLLLAVAWIYARFGLQVTWLAGWLPTLLVAGVILFMRSRKFFAILVLVAVVAVALNSDYFLNKVLADESNESGGTRMAAWEVNWQVTGKHLLFGTGPGGYAAYYMSYFPNDAMATHNNYIDVIAQTGVFGLALCIWFFFRLAWLGYQVCLRLKGRNDFAEALANAAMAGTIGCIVAMAIGDWLFPFAYTQTIAGYDYVVYSWLFMGAILALDRLYPATRTKLPELYEGAL